MNRPKQRAGFTLLEVLLAVSIFSAGIVFLIQGLSLMTKSGKRIRDNQIAFLAMDNCLNRIYGGEKMFSDGEDDLWGVKVLWRMDRGISVENLNNVNVRIYFGEDVARTIANFEHKIFAPID